MLKADTPPSLCMSAPAIAQRSGRTVDLLLTEQSLCYHLNYLLFLSSRDLRNVHMSLTTENTLSVYGPVCRSQCDPLSGRRWGADTTHRGTPDPYCEFCLSELAMAKLSMSLYCLLFFISNAAWVN